MIPRLPGVRLKPMRHPPNPMYPRGSAVCLRDQMQPQSPSSIRHGAKRLCGIT